MDKGEIKELDIMIASSIIFGPPIRLIQLRLDGLIESPLPELYDDTVENIWSGIAEEETRQELKLTANYT
jgi:hypothetical protein